MSSTKIVAKNVISKQLVNEINELITDDLFYLFSTGQVLDNTQIKNTLMDDLQIFKESGKIEQYNVWVNPTTTKVDFSIYSQYTDVIIVEFRQKGMLVTTSLTYLINA